MASHSIYQLVLLGLMLVFLQSQAVIIDSIVSSGPIEYVPDVKIAWWPQPKQAPVLVVPDYFEDLTSCQNSCDQTTSTCIVVQSNYYCYMVMTFYPFNVDEGICTNNSTEIKGVLANSRNYPQIFNTKKLSLLPKLVCMVYRDFIYQNNVYQRIVLKNPL